MSMAVAENLSSGEMMNSKGSLADTNVSEEKYKRMKKRLKEMIERNELLANDLYSAKKRLRRLAKEKTILLDRICKYSDPPSQPSDIDHPHQHQHQHQHQQNYKEITTSIQETPPVIDPDDSASTVSDSFGEKEKGVVKPMNPPRTPLPSQTLSDTSSPSTVEEYDSIMDVSPSQPINPAASSSRIEVSVIRDGTMVPSSRPKRMRRGPVEQKMRRVQPLERDTVTGEYKLPARVGILTVHSLGHVVPLPAYHNDRYIWPVGFKVSRTYLSMVNANANTLYTCSVEENGSHGPKFRVYADDCPDQPIVANSATGVWTAIVKRANEIRNREHSNSASGPDYYGFTHATIAKMIQDLPGADQCQNYVWQKFGVMHQRTAAGVAAAAQKKLTNLEIMGSANKKPPASYTGHPQTKEEFHSMSPMSFEDVSPTGTAHSHMPDATIQKYGTRDTATNDPAALSQSVIRLPPMVEAAPPWPSEEAH
ncbi:F/Y rich C-terminus-domain-containing protein [Radiomyces spectabilis]|uniref:F/Y rich C-terminus-domain-containing protein n=1 Tax=Radiomyces spectabilis TaxID=64574 RepID=UPI00221FAA27|nr:F/Y rich C-terminus-domain-containing protein [Radiomyces spectabilis]KAI8372710.1 F/Y rich C-terminus-domain-containing protein [Radiomyces spectabilis]